MSSTEEALLPRAGIAESSAAVEARSGRWWHVVLPVLVIALAVVPKLWFFDARIWGTDEAILLIYPEQIRAGRIPNQDFFTVYGPGNYVTLAAVYSFLGQSLLAERLVGLVYQVAIVSGVMAVNRRHGRVASITGGVLATVLLHGSSIVAFSWFGGLALSLWSLVLLRRDGTRAAVAAGVLAGLASFWRIEMGVLAIAALPLLWRSTRLRSYIIGVGIGAVPTLLHLTVAGPQVMRNVFLDRMGVNAQVDWSLLPLSLALLSLLLVGAAVSLLVVATLRKDMFLLSAALFVILLLPQAFQRVDFMHVVFLTGSVAYPMALAAFAGTKRNWRRSFLVVAPAGGAVGIAVVTVIFTLQAVSAPPGEEAKHLGRSVYVPDAAQLESLVAAINRHVPAGSRVFVGSSDMSVATTNRTALYQLLPEYRNDFYFIELHAGVAERAGSPLVHDIETADALVLNDHNPQLKLLYPHFPAGSDDANRAVDEGFCPVERLMDVTIYVAKDAHCS